MHTHSALGENSEEHVFDACSDDELLAEQNSGCPLLELRFYCVGRCLVKALGVDSPMRVSET